jgi:OOP family OmpA-OmpF porin
MKNGRWLLLMGFLAAAAAGPAAAQDRGIYLGGSWGQAEYADTCDDLALISGCTDNDNGFRFFAGYQFNRNFGLELGYADLGVVRAEGTFLGTPTRFGAETTGFDLTGVLSFTLVDRLSLFGRLGAYRMRTEVDLNFGGAESRDGETNGGLTYGLGLGYELGILGVRLEWQRYDNVGGGSTGEDTVDFFSLGALIRF